MRVFLAILILASSFYFLPSPAFADFNSAYQDYIFRFQQYKTAHNEYQVAKSTYQTYKTLTAQNDAIAKFKNVLKARDQIMASYYDLIQEKLNATQGVTDDTKNTFNGVRSSEKTWLSDHQKSVDAAESLEDLNKVSDEFETRHPQMDRETKQAIGTVFIAKEEVLKGKLDSNINSVNAKLSEIRSQGENTTAADRGLISIQNKLTFQATKVETAKKIFSGTENRYQDTIDLLKGQKALIEANQYLKEAASYLLEIVHSFTG